MTKEKRIIARIVADGCVVCRKLGLGESPACFHHTREVAGIGQKSDVVIGLPLCYRHHQGAEGIHHLGKRAWEAKFGDQRELLAWDRAQRERA